LPRIESEMKRFVSLFLIGAGVLAALLAWPRENKRARGVMPSEVYVWQRSWTPSLEDAIAERAEAFAELVALNAEVTWRSKQPHVTRVALDYAALRSSGRPVGLALRVGPFAGPFAEEDQRTRYLADLAVSLVEAAKSHGLHPAELQIDFDAAESKLDGYRVWVEAIRNRVAPMPVTITALPSWLNRAAFKRLIAAADGYVLQVHSLARPRDARAPFSLCDPTEAKRAVEKAGRLSKPFRVALPTYGYQIAFDRGGKFVGLSAEGPAKLWPEGTQLREVRADPQAMAELIARWINDRPRALTGVIWYRLPVEGDTLNWSWPTLAAVMDGQVPRPGLRVELRRPKPGLVEVDLINAGQADHNAPVRVGLTWNSARFVAGDALQGFELKGKENAVEFAATPDSARLEAGRRRTIGWVRLDQPAEVHAALEP